MAEYTSSLQRLLARLPVELQWRIGNEVLFGTHTLPSVDELARHPCTRTGHDATLRSLQLQLIVRQRRDAFVQLQRERRWMRAIQTRHAATIEALLNDDADDAPPSATVLNALRHSVKQTAFYTSGSAAYMLAVLDVLERVNGHAWLPADRADVLGRMIEYCVKEEEVMLLHASVWWLLLSWVRRCDAAHIVKLEQRARCALFEWSNVDRLPHYMHALTMHGERSNGTAAAATLLHDMPLTVVVLTAWIAVEAWNRRVAVAVLKAVAVVLAGVLGRRMHARLRRQLVRKVYRQIHGNAIVVRQQLAPRDRRDQEQQPTADRTTAAARRPRQQWWCNEILVRNASSRNTLRVHAYNAADHYLLTHAFSSTVVAPRSVALVRSAWDLRGTRIVVSRCVDDGGTQPNTRSYVDWRRGSTFNLHRKPSLLVAKNATLTVRDGDFVGDTTR